MSTKSGEDQVDKKLVPDLKSAKVVKALYEVFIETGSFKKVVEYTRERGIKHSYKNNLISENGVYKLLRNPVYLGKIMWHGKVMQGTHEPIISEDLFLEAQGLTKERLRKKRVYKEYLLSRLVKCAVCGSAMTNTFTNKKKRRYYYYKCIKVVKEGRGACSLKQVNAEKLESFVFESLERISKDENYIESLVFKTLRMSPPSRGFELSTESEKSYSQKIIHVLQGYASDFKKGSQLEKQLVTKRTIEKIILSRESMEVIVTLEDRRDLKLAEGLANRLGGSVYGTREGAVNPDAPACNTLFESKTGGEKRIRTSDTLRYIRFRGGRIRPLCHLSEI